MNNKNILFGFITVLLIASIAGVIAEEANTDTATTNIVIAGNPDASTATLDAATTAEINDDLSGSASIVDEGVLKVRFWFTFNQEKKAELELKLARLQLVKAKIAAKNNNTIAMEKALLAHNRIIEKVQARINAIADGTTESEIKQTAEKVVGLERAIEVHEARIAKLNEILSSGNLTEEKMQKLQEKIIRVENVIEKLKENQLAKKEKIKTKLMSVSGIAEEKADEEIQKIEDAQNIEAVKKKVAEIKAQRNENAADKIAGVIAKLAVKQDETGKNLSNAITKLTAVQQKLQDRADAIRERIAESGIQTENSGEETQIQNQEQT